MKVNENPISDYRRHLIDALIAIEKAADDIHLSIVNIAMSGEMADVDTLFEKGESLNFKLEDFSQMADQNIQILISILMLITDKHDEIKNINAITTKEMRDLISIEEETDDEDLPF